MPDALMKKHAFLIGLNGYQILPKLNYARQDAEAVALALKQNYCFLENEITVLSDAKQGWFKPTNRDIIEENLRRLEERELDLLIFGFWGHGLIRNGKLYLCPMDVMETKVEKQGFSFDELLERLYNIYSKNTCIILDCCQTVHDRGEVDSLTAAVKTRMENVPRDIVLKRTEQIPDVQYNVAILNSCKEGQRAYEWDERQHGLFTAHLLDAMNQRLNSVIRIAGYISSTIEQTALALGKHQTPYYKLEGDIALPVASSPMIQSPTFVLPERSKDAVIQRPIINDINVTVSSGQIERRQPIQYKEIQLPPLPEELVNYQAENKEREKTIAQLRDFTHDSLTQANDAVAQMQTQFDAWKERKERLWKNLPLTFRQSLESTITANPQCTEADLKVSTYNMSNHEYFLLLEQLECGKKYEQARLELERVKKQRRQKCDNVIQALRRESISENKKVEKKLMQFMDEVLLTILEVMPGYDDLKAAFPLDVLREPLLQLDKYGLCWRGPDEIARARVLWNEKRPCVLDHYVRFNNPRSPFVWDGTRIKKYVGNEINVTIPKGATEIMDAAFKGCHSIESVVIPEGVTKIGNYAYKDCDSLTSVIISNSVTDIGIYAFTDCSSLTSIVIPEGVREIGDCAFRNCRSLKSVDIPEGVSKIGEGVFYGCNYLTSATLPKSVTRIENWMFYDCYYLQSVEIPPKVVEIGKYAFEGCRSLTSVIIPEDVTVIGKSAFCGCCFLKSVVIPEGLLKIEKCAFCRCNSIESIVIPESVTDIEDYAFEDCRSLNSVTISSPATKIGECAFNNCRSLKSVKLPTLVKIGKNAFKGCSVPWFSRMWWHNIWDKLKFWG